MEVLRTSFRPRGLAQMFAHKSLGLWLPRTVVVTFDDGYADNYLNARPILQRYEIPATVFVATGFVGSKRIPYWDELAHLFLQTPSLPAKLDLILTGEKWSWNFNGEPSVDSTWNILQEGHLARQKAYQVLCDHLRSLSPPLRDALLEKLREWVGPHRMTGYDNQFMTVEQLSQLPDDDFIEVGAHTANHPDLAVLTAEEQRQEIAGGKCRLEQIIGRRVRSFAYPYGSVTNYTRETIRIVKEEGFDCACSNFSGPVWFGSDRFQLPRILVRDWSADEFEKNIGGYAADI